MTERFIVDTAGTLIDMETRNTYDYVSEVRPLLNEMAKENKKLKSINNQLEDRLEESGIGIALKMEDFE